MIIIFVEHYLTETGKKIFFQWIKGVEVALSEFNGFNSITALKDLEDDNRTILILKFESYKLLKIWTTSKEHDVIIEKLKKYMIKKPKTQILEVL